MGSKKNVDMSANTDEIKIIEADQNQAANENTDAATAETASDASDKAVKTAVKPKQAKERSKKYVSTRSQVDKTKLYDTFAAVELVKKLSYTKFDGSITADVVVKEAGQTADVTFPHTTGKTLRVAIASDEVIAQIEQGSIEFDVLVTDPSFMPKLARHAKTLGPKGLMPNPKNGTITPNPELKKKELEGGKTTLKTEKKAPLMHVTIGKVSMDTQALVENLNALIEALKGKAVKLSLSASMSPSVKVMVG